MSDLSPAATTVRSAAAIETKFADRYMGQLCKHFAHKRPVTHDDRAGHIAFPIGDCRLSADAGSLLLSLEASDSAQLEQLQDVVARHLLRFAFREDMQIDWHAA